MIDTLAMMNDKEVVMRMRRIAAVIIAIVALASALGVAASQQISLLGASHTTEIDGSQPSFVSHGWLEYKDVWQSMGYKTYRSYIDGEGIEFLLEVDGVLLDPTNRVIRFLPKHPVYGAIWSAKWIYRFAPNEFSEGWHTFEGFITINGMTIPYPAREVYVQY